MTRPETHKGIQYACKQQANKGCNAGKHDSSNARKLGGDKDAHDEKESREYTRLVKGEARRLRPRRKRKK
jgi:hypothetical protein